MHHVWWNKADSDDKESLSTQNWVPFTFSEGFSAWNNVFASSGLFGLYGQFALTSSSKGLSLVKSFGCFKKRSLREGFLGICSNTEAWIFSCVLSSVIVGRGRWIVFAIENIPVAELENKRSTHIRLNHTPRTCGISWYPRVPQAGKGTKDISNLTIEYHQFEPINELISRCSYKAFLVIPPST